MYSFSNLDDANFFLSLSIGSEGKLCKTSVPFS